MTARETITLETRNTVLERDGYTCRYCGSQDGPFHMDHVYPVSKGGETSIENLVTACQKCNLSKSNRIGIWPHPIGYDDNTDIDEHETKPSRIFVDILLLFSLVAIKFVTAYIAATAGTIESQVLLRLNVILIFFGIVIFVIRALQGKEQSNE